MPRKAVDKPWFHAASGLYCATVQGKREYLDADFSVACRKLRQLRRQARQPRTGWREWLEAPFAELAAEFLEDNQARRSSGTYRNNQQRLSRAMQTLGPQLRVSDVRRFHLAKIEQAMTGSYSSATVRDTIAVVQQVFNWAVTNDLLDYNPVDKYKKPAGGGRSRLMTPQEFQQLLRLSDPCFRRFLIALRHTGCRPGEVRKLTWDMVHLDKGLWIIPHHKTRTMQREPGPRVVPLPDCIWKLCRWLARQPREANDIVFKHSFGGPYTKDGLVRKMARLRRRAGIGKQAGENIVLYTNRHTFATGAVGKVSDTELAELMGHTTTRTLRRYVHLNADRLRDIQRRIQG